MRGGGCWYGLRMGEAGAYCEEEPSPFYWNPEFKTDMVNSQ